MTNFDDSHIYPFGMCLARIRDILITARSIILLNVLCCLEMAAQ